MLDKIKNFFKKTPKGFVALPIAVAAVALVTVLALPFFGNNASSDSGNKGPVISFGDKDNNADEDDNDSNGSGDLVGDNGSSENDGSNSNTDSENDGNSGSTDNNNDPTGNEDEDNTGDGSTGGNEGTTSNPSGSTDKDPDDSDDENSSNNSGSSDNNSGSSGDNDSSNSGNTGDNDGGNSGNNSGNTGDSDSGNSGGNNDGNTGNNGGTIDGNGSTSLEVPGIDLSEIPAYSGSDYIMLNDDVGNDKTIGIPYFSTTHLSTTAFEFYSELDSLGRCGMAYACLGPELLPDEEREDIDSVTPSGWVDSDGLYNRSHLIAHSLAGENDNPKNLITGTSHMNQHTMQIYETLVLDYIKETGNHVIYRVTPMFEGNNLVATGVQMEAWSIEDNGESICFNVFCYNIQEGVTIDYATGQFEIEKTEYLYMVNGNNKNGKIHTYECGVQQNLKVGIPCKTLEEAQAKSMEITGKSTPLYAGCCMSGSTSYDNNVVGTICHCSHDHSTVITEDIRFYTTIAVRNIITNTKKNVFMA